MHNRTLGLASLVLVVGMLTSHSTPGADTAPAGAPRELLLCDFEAPEGDLNLGGEFPGAVGSFETSSEAAHAGGAGGRLTFDLTRGAYVAWTYALPQPLAEGASVLTVWVRTDAEGRNLHCKTRDATGQEHIRNASVGQPGEWRQVSFDLTTSAGHWAGANDGRIHWPITLVQIGVEAKGTAKKGTLDLDDMRVRTTASAAAQPGWLMRLESGRFGNLFYPGESVEFTVVTRCLETGTPPTLGGEYVLQDWLAREVARGRIDAVSFGADAGKRVPVRLGATLCAGAFTLSLSVQNPQTPDQVAAAQVWFGVLPGPNPPPCPWVGTGLHGGHGWGRGDLRFLDILSAAGIGTVREEFGWSGIEKVKGQYAVSPRVEEFVNALNAKGIRLNLLLTYGNAVYENPLDPEAYAHWAGWMATHFAGKVRDFEIWNEPANFLFQKQYGGERFGNAPWIAKFVELSLAASKAIRQARPDATVVVCAEDCWPTLKQMLDEGIGPAGDVISIHPYCHGQPRPEREWFLRDGGRELRDVSVAHGGPTRVVITEAGWTTYEGEMEFLAIAGGYPRSSYVHQAQYLVRMYLTAAAAGVDYSVQYDFRNDGNRRNYTEHNFGLVHEDATPKPSLMAVATLTRLLGQARFVGDASPDPKRLRAYVFNVGETPVVAAYAVEGIADLSLRVGQPQVAVCDLMGNRRPAICHDGVLQTQVTEIPIYILGAGPEVLLHLAQVTVHDSELAVAAGDTAETSVVCENRTGRSIRPTLRCRAPEGTRATVGWKERSWLPVSIPDGKDRTATLSVQTRADSSVPVTVALLADIGDLALQREIVVRPKPPVTVSLGTLNPDGAKWSVALRLTNASRRALGLSAQAVTPPGSVVAEPAQLSLGLAPGETAERALTFATPPTEPLTVRLLTSDQWTTEVSACLLPGTVEALKAIPTIDGSLDEWAGATAFALAAAGQYDALDAHRPWAGPDDLSARVLFGWCNDGLCIGVQARDNTFDQPHANDSIWQADSVQLAIAPGASGSGRLEIGVARTPQGDRCFTYSPLVEGDAAKQAPIRYASTKKDAEGGVAYEVLIPWAQLPGVKPEAGAVFRFSLLVNDSDGAGRRGWLHAFDGIGRTKDPSQYGTMTLAPAK